MSELIVNIFQTSVLINMLAVLYIKARGEASEVSYIEKVIFCGAFVISLITLIVSAMVLIWI